MGPGRLLAQVLPGAEIVRTIIAGDNWAAENLDDLRQAVVQAVREAQAELFVAGPCFEAGRYGVAAGAACAAVQQELGIPVTGAGLNRDEAHRPLIIEKSGVRFGFMQRTSIFWPRGQAAGPCSPT